MDTHEDGARAGRAPELILLAAVLVAIAVALAGLLERGAEVPAGAVATVNGEPVPGERFEELLRSLARQTGATPGEAERAEVLSRLIDEELLLQQGLALGLPRAEARLRAQIVQEVVGQAVAGSAAEPADPAAVEAFYEAHRGYFRRPALLGVARLLFDDEAAARAFLAGAAQWPAAERWARVLAEQPEAMFAGPAVPESKLRELLGSGVAERLAALPPGEGLVQLAPQGAVALLLVSREDPGVPALASIRAQVESEYRRRRDEQALDAYVERLRADASIRLAPPARAP